MAVNLVSLIMQFLTPDMIGRIASALGLDRNSTQTAIGAAVPALLAGLSGVAAQPGGAQKLVDAAKQQAGALDSFANMLGGAGQSSLIEKGTQVLSSLLSGRDHTALAGAVGKFAGLSQSAGSSLLGMLAPVVMGTIAQQGGRGLDAGRIASLLAGQKDNIAAALPSGFGNLLGASGLLDALGGAARTATAVGGEAARATASAARTIGDTGLRAAGATAAASRNWLYWVIPIAAIAALLIYLVGKPAEQVASLQTATVAPNLTVGGLDVGKQVTDSIANLRTALGDVTDAATAQAALPKLKDATAQIDKVGGLIGQLSPEQRKILAGLVGPLMPKLNELFDKVLAIPGVAAVLKPTVEAVKGQLATLAA
jgi:hypothetical protein